MWVAVERPQVNLANLLARWAVEHEPGLPGQNGGTDRRREPQFLALRLAPVPDADDAPGLALSLPALGEVGEISLKLWCASVRTHARDDSRRRQVRVTQADKEKTGLENAGSVYAGGRGHCDWIGLDLSCFLGLRSS
jgi:hypothetical protein